MVIKFVKIVSNCVKFIKNVFILQKSNSKSKFDPKLYIFPRFILFIFVSNFVARSIKRQTHQNGAKFKTNKHTCQIYRLIDPSNYFVFCFVSEMTETNSKRGKNTFFRESLRGTMMTSLKIDPTKFRTASLFQFSVKHGRVLFEWKFFEYGLTAFDGP